MAFITISASTPYFSLAARIIPVGAGRQQWQHMLREMSPDLLRMPIDDILGMRGPREQHAGINNQPESFVEL
jgi:hypothetical protein